jgi:hypothetical protein
MKEIARFGFDNKPQKKSVMAVVRSGPHWWAYYNDEKPLGPFAREAEAARAGLEAWGKETALGGPS